jgi:hypothetical protein
MMLLDHEIGYRRLGELKESLGCFAISRFFFLTNKSVDSWIMTDRPLIVGVF